jgi:hypothetical protein
MCYACAADRQGVSWASFSHDPEMRNSFFSPDGHDTYGRQARIYTPPQSILAQPRSTALHNGHPWRKVSHS